MAFNNFPYTDAHELNLDWIIKKQKATAVEAEEALNTANEANNKVDNFLDNLDLQDEVNTKLDQMEESGELGTIISQYIPQENVIIITASYGETEPVGVIIDPFTAQVKRRLEYNSNRKVYYAASGGASFAPADDSVYLSFTEVIQTLAGTIPEPGRIGLVLVVGGGNDVWHERSAISNGMDTFCRYVKANYPNAEMRFAWCSWRLKFSAVMPYRKYNETIDIFKEICPRHGMAFCANSEYIFHQYFDEWYAGVGDAKNNHPSTEGSRHFADHIVDCIINGSTEVIRTDVFDPEAATNPRTFLSHYNPEYPDFVVEDCAAFTIRQVNGVTSVIPGNTPGYPTFKMKAGPGWFQKTPTASREIADFDSGLLKCTVPNDLCTVFPVGCMLVRSVENDEDYKWCTGYAFFLANKLYMSFKRDFAWQVNHWDEMQIYMPSVDIPTAYA